MYSVAHARSLPAVLVVCLAPVPVQAAVPACPAPPEDAVAVVPATADFVVGGRPAEIDGERAGQHLLSLAALDLQMGEWQRLRAACFSGSGTGAPVSVSVAGSGTGDFAWVLRGEGVASEVKVACVADWFSRRDEGVAPWSAPHLASGGCIRAYASESPRAIAALSLENHTLILTSASWFGTVLASLEDRELRAKELEESARLVRDPAHSLWAAGTLHRAPGYLSQVPWPDTIRNFGARAHLRKGLSLSIVVETSDFAAATTLAVAQLLPRVFAQWTQRGVPEALLAKIEISRSAELFLARWELDQKELRTLARSIASAVQGGMI